MADILAKKLDTTISHMDTAYSIVHLDKLTFIHGGDPNRLIGVEPGTIPLHASDNFELSNGDTVLVVHSKSVPDKNVGTYKVIDNGSKKLPFVLERTGNIVGHQTVSGHIIVVKRGEKYGSTMWICTTPVPFTVDESELLFLRIGSRVSVPSSAVTVKVHRPFGELQVIDPFREAEIEKLAKIEKDRKEASDW